MKLTMSDTSSPKITWENVLSGCGKFSGAYTGRSLTSIVWSNLDRGKPGHWLRMFEWSALFVACAFPGQLALFPPRVLNGSFGMVPPAILVSNGSVCQLR